jgi:GNAT superfamily N-acetyltransferase
MPVIQPCGPDDLDAILAIINEAALAYRGAIPADCWHEPYMAAADLQAEIAAGVEFWGYLADDGMAGVMGLQRRHDLDLIRHAYVRPGGQRHGAGGALVEHLRRQSRRRMLVAVWQAAAWAIRFYRRHGFDPVPERRRVKLLETHWKMPARQIETSTVLANPPFAA